MFFFFFWPFFHSFPRNWDLSFQGTDGKSLFQWELGSFHGFITWGVEIESLSRWPLVQNPEMLGWSRIQARGGEVEKRVWESPMEG